MRARRAPRDFERKYRQRGYAGYRRDLDFESIIRRAEMDDDRPAPNKKWSACCNRPWIFKARLSQRQLERIRMANRLDGNSVGLDRQLALLNENALSYDELDFVFARWRTCVTPSAKEGDKRRWIYSKCLLLAAPA
jgi:hypothetical protein